MWFQSNPKRGRTVRCPPFSSQHSSSLEKSRGTPVPLRGAVQATLLRCLIEPWCAGTLSLGRASHALSELLGYIYDSLLARSLDEDGRRAPGVVPARRAQRDGLCNEQVRGYGGRTTAPQDEDAAVGGMPQRRPAAAEPAQETWRALQPATQQRSRALGPGRAKREQQQSPHRWERGGRS